MQLKLAATLVHYSNILMCCMKGDWGDWVWSFMLHCDRAQAIILWQPLFNHEACQEECDWNAKTTKEINHCKWGSYIKVVAYVKRTRQEFWFHVLRWWNRSGLMRKKRDRQQHERQEDSKKWGEERRSKKDGKEN